jgi:hypothetical protein
LFSELVAERGGRKMKNIIDKSVIEGKLAELEQDLLALEERFVDKVSTNMMDHKLENDAFKIDQQLSEMIFRISLERETHLKNDNYQSQASCFPFVATNL